MSLKNNKYARRLAAALMTGAMMVSMMGMTAMAQGPSDVTKLDFSKVINAGENVLMPNAEFTFAVEEVTVNPGETVADGSVPNITVPVKDGIEGGVYFGTKENKVYETTLAFTAGQNENSKTGTICFDSSVFKNEGVGVYRYKILEKDIDKSDGKNEGITKGDVTEYYLDLWVTDPDEDGENFIIAGVVAHTGDSTKKASAVVIDNEYATNAITIKKVVDGNQGDKKADFTFSIKIEGESEEQYKVVYGTGTETTLTSGEEQDIKLANGETATVYGLSENDKYTVREREADQNGYTTTIKIGDKEVNDVTGKTTADGTEITFTNTRNVDTPTGVILNIAPYILMVALAGVLAFFFLRKRHYEM